jgi:LuxR family transcriptional regulator, maltose regulon positive regulatory protein
MRVHMGRAGQTETAQAAGVGRDGLLATKLHVPRPRPGFLLRPRLLERLAGGAGRELVLVSTPAGFGKTTLLGDWARRSQQPVAWLSLEPGDNDPVRFWRYVVAALDGAGTGLGDQVAPLLGPQAGSLEAVVTEVINGLAGLTDRRALVLDDYHVIEAPPVHHSVGFLLERLPAQLQVVVASRIDPPLPLARLRVRGQLVELRERDLRFTEDEAAALLRDGAGLDLPTASLAALLARTEGWVAGLQLAALSLQGRSDPAGFVAGFSGSHRFVLDYLAEEVLDGQPPELRSFLLETSVLERLCGGLCDAVTGRADSQATLEQIERANLFLHPLDEERRWWRYHRLFADLLRARLQQAEPDRVPALHRNAAAWLETHRQVDEAVGHALAAGEADWAARLVEQHTQERFQLGEGATVARWLAALPAELVHARPRLSLAGAVWALIGGRVDEVEPLLAHAEHASTTGERSTDAPAAGHANVPAMLAILRAELARQHGDADRTIAFAQQALPQIAEDDRLLRYLVAWNLAVAMLLQGRVGDAEQALADVVADRWTAGEPYNALRACYTLSQAQRAQGRLGAALATCRQGLERAVAAGRAALPASGVAQLGLAEILRERNELDAALDHAGKGVELCRQLGYAQWQVTSLAALAWIRQARGDQAGALEAVQDAERVLPSREVVTDLIFPATVQRARLLLAQGQLAAAARWVSQRGLAAGDEPDYAHERESLVLARLLIAGQTPDQALPLLERLHHLAAVQGRVGSRIEVRVLQALALAAGDEEADALDALAEALALACPEGYVRVFVDEGAPIADLLGKLIAARGADPTLAAGVPPGYLRQLADAIGQEAVPIPIAGRGAATATPGLIEPLSARELEVLELLAAGRANRQIADELVVALDTVKKHVSHILDKLGASNRTQAVARARDLGLIS